MIPHLDNILSHMMLTEIDELTDETQVRFQPSEEDWCNKGPNPINDRVKVSTMNIKRSLSVDISSYDRFY